jgi:hypothetical protein
LELLKLKSPPRRPITRARTPALEPLEQRQLLTADPVITEFMASNGGTLDDGAGDASDWIEIYNAGDMEVDLGGWHLTDSAGNLDKWTFPSVTLGPAEYLVVFASGTNQPDAQGHLHTNFKLDAGGEYLALVEPDGNTIATEFGLGGTGYPPQFRNISYGFPTEATTTELIDDGATAHTLVPADGTFEASWFETDFAIDGHWAAGPTGVGWTTEFPNDALIGTDIETTMYGANATAYVRVPFNILTASALDEIDQLTMGMKYDDGFVAYLNGTEVARRNAPETLAWNSSATQDVAGVVTGPSVVVADLRADYDAHVPVAGQSSIGKIADSSGSGQWNFFDSATANPADPGAGLTPLTFSTTQPHAVVAANSYIDSAQGFGLPGIQNGQLILGGNEGAPDDDEVAVHPGQAGRTYMVSRWTAGEGEDGEVIVSGTARELGVVCNGITFAIYVDGTSGFDGGRITDNTGVDFDFTTTVDVGDHVDFVVGSNGSFACDQSALSATISVSLPPTGVQHYGEEQIDLSGYVGLLNVGDNILAIQGLNAADDDSDFLIAPTLVGTSAGVVDVADVRYFLQPTPRELNGVGTGNLGPHVTQVGHRPSVTADDEDIIVTASVGATREPVDAVTLHYRVMYDQEVAVVMSDDGSGTDQTAGDGVFTAAIPHAAAAPGEMVRYYVTAADVQANVTRAPLFLDQSGNNQSPEYFGTVVANSAVVTDLPVFQWFLKPGTEAAAETRTGTRASVYYDGRFYDNVFVRLRGLFTHLYIKSSFKFDFNTGHDFYYSDTVGYVTEINLNHTADDKSYLRETLGYEIFRDAGSAYSETFPVRVQRNGEFYSVAILIEQVDEDYLERHGLDPNGALYKAVNGGATLAYPLSSDYEKKSRRDEDSSDLADLAIGVAPSNANRAEYVFDNVNLPAVINVMASWVIFQDSDHFGKNYYVYRDTEGTGEWRMLPWDLDLSFGTTGLFSDAILADWDGQENVLSSAASHPFSHSSQWSWNSGWQRLVDAIIDIPETREMFLRHLRTQMDQLLQPPGTDPAQLKFERRVDELFAAMEPDVLLDKAEWGNPFGTPETFIQSLTRLKNEYFAVRRTHLYNTHSIGNLPGGTTTTVLGSSVPARAIVPTDDTLGLTWTEIDFDDAAWIAGTTGVGFERAGGYEGQIGLDLLSESLDASLRIDTDGDGVNENDSVYIRIPFHVADPTAIEQLTLKMKYDDGFIAYINGTRVADANAPNPVDWNSGATAYHHDSQALVFQNFSVASPSTLLQTGTNVLAIHGLNDNTAAGPGRSNDMLIVPELEEGNAGGYIHAAGIPHEQIGNPTIEFGRIEVSPESGNQDEEYIELVNPNNTAVDISGWRLTGGIQYTFAPGTVIGAGANVYVSPNVVAFRTRASGPSGNQGQFVLGDYQGHLSNLGEQVDLVSKDGTLVNTFTTPHAPSEVQQFLRVSELHYNPAVAGDTTEFIELTNISDTVTLDLAGVSITDGPSDPFVFPAATRLAPGEFLLVVKDQAAFVASYPDISPSLIVGEFSGSLSNTGERIKVEDIQHNTVVDFTYGDDDPWPERSDGSGASLELIPAVVADADAARKYYHWRGSTEFGGSPGSHGSGPRGIVVNEVLANSEPELDAIELHNTTDADVDISGWFLSDSDQNLLKFEIPAGTILGGGAYTVFDESDFNPTPNSPEDHHFALSGAEGDDVWLVIPDGGGGVQSIVDDVHFRATFTGQTLGRTSRSAGRLVPVTRNTLGCGNSQPLVGDVVIGEIHYDPELPTAAALALEPNLDENDLEYLEIFSDWSAVVDLSDWRIRGGVSFDFPDVVLSSGPLIIVSFDTANPANANRLAAFREHYGLTEFVPIVGGYDGRLSNSGEPLRLERPDAAPPGDPGLTPFVTVDEVIYDNLSPWPTTASGTGESIERRASVFFGNDGAMWQATAANPGSLTVLGNAIRGDFNGDDLVDANDIDLLYDAVNRDSSVSYYVISGTLPVPTRVEVEYLVHDMLHTDFGDANLDGSVDGVDWGIWNSHSFQSCTGWATADFNGDGKTDGADFNLWNDNKFVAAAAKSATEPPLARSRLGIPVAVFVPPTVDSLLRGNPRSALEVASQVDLGRLHGETFQQTETPLVANWARVMPRATERPHFDSTNAGDFQTEFVRTVDRLFADAHVSDLLGWAEYFPATNFPASFFAILKEAGIFTAGVLHSSFSQECIFPRRGVK